MKAWGHLHSSQKTTSVRLMWSLFIWEYTREKAENRISHYCLRLKSQLLLKNTSTMWDSCECKRSHLGLSLLPNCSQNHREVNEREQSCHPREPDSHYSIRIYPSMHRKSAFIRSFYRWTFEGSLLGMDDISCAVIIKSQNCSHSSVRLYSTLAESCMCPYSQLCILQKSETLKRSSFVIFALCLFR